MRTGMGRLAGARAYAFGHGAQGGIRAPVPAGIARSRNARGPLAPGSRRCGAEWLPIPLGIIALVFAPGLLRLPSRGAAGRETCRRWPRTDEIENDEWAEFEALLARVAALEAERAEEIARAHATVAAAQEHLYWIDRLQLDLERRLGSPAGSARLSAVVPCGCAGGPRGCSCAVCAAGCAARCADRRLLSPLLPCRVPAPKR